MMRFMLPNDDTHTHTHSPDTRHHQPHGVCHLLGHLSPLAARKTIVVVVVVVGHCGYVHVRARARCNVNLQIVFATAWICKYVLCVPKPMLPKFSVQLAKGRRLNRDVGRKGIRRRRRQRQGRARPRILCV